MDGREHQVVLIERRPAGEIAGGGGGIERETGEEGAARGVLAGELLELLQVGERVGTAERRSRARWYHSRAWSSAGPARDVRGSASALQRPVKSPPDRSPPLCGGVKILSAASEHRLGRLEELDAPRAHYRPHPRQQLQRAKRGQRVARVVAQRSTASRSLMWAASRNFTRGTSRTAPGADQLHLEQVAGAGTAKQHRLASEHHAASRRLSISAQTYSAWVGKLPTENALRPHTLAPIDSRCLRCWRGASAMSVLGMSSTPGSSGSSGPA